MNKTWGPEPAVDDEPAAVTGRQRAVLHLLREACAHTGARPRGPRRTEGLTVAEVASGLDLHINTVREHLEALVEAGFAVRSPARTQGRGRPAWMYRPAAPSHDPRFAAYRGMSLALASHLARTGDDPGAAARDLGRQWGHELSGAADDDADRVVQDLTRLGFAPIAEADGSYSLTRCPLLDAARRYPEVTCQLHLGLIRGILDPDRTAAGDGPEPTAADVDSPVEPVLIPFAQRGACTLRLATRPQS